MQMHISILNSPPRSETSTVDSELSESILVQNSKKYNRISGDTRDSLLGKIFFENKKIKIAAKELNMNYSTAKTILHLYRKKQKKAGKKIKEENRCNIKSFNINDVNNVEIVITQGGKILQRNQPMMLKKTICKSKDIEDEEKYMNYQYNLNVLMQQYKMAQNMRVITKKAEIKPSNICQNVEIKGEIREIKDECWKRNVIIIKPINT